METEESKLRRIGRAFMPAFVSFAMACSMLPIAALQADVAYAEDETPTVETASSTSTEVVTDLAGFKEAVGKAASSSVTIDIQGEVAISAAYTINQPNKITIKCSNGGTLKLTKVLTVSSDVDFVDVDMGSASTNYIKVTAGTSTFKGCTLKTTGTYPVVSYNAGACVVVYSGTFEGKSYGLYQYTGDLHFSPVSNISTKVCTSVYACGFQVLPQAGTVVNGTLDNEAIAFREDGRYLNPLKSVKTTYDLSLSVSGADGIESPALPEAISDVLPACTSYIDGVYLSVYSASDTSIYNAYASLPLMTSSEGDIYYTLDDTVPALNSDGSMTGNKYESNIHIKQATAITMVSVKDGIVSQPRTMHYDVTRVEITFGDATAGSDGYITVPMTVDLHVAEGKITSDTISYDFSLQFDTDKFQYVSSDFDGFKFNNDSEYPDWYTLTTAGTTTSTTVNLKFKIIDGASEGSYDIHANYAYYGGGDKTGGMHKHVLYVTESIQPITNKGTMTIGQAGSDVTYSVTIGDKVNGSIVVTKEDGTALDAAGVKEGEVVKITATPDSGYELDGLTLTGLEQKDTASGLYTVKVGDAGTVSASATFSKKQYALNIPLVDGGSIVVKKGEQTLANGDTVEYGDELTITAEPVSGYALDGDIAVTGATSKGDGAYVVDDSATGVTVLAAFAKKSAISVADKTQVLWISQAVNSSNVAYTPASFTYSYDGAADVTCDSSDSSVVTAVVKDKTVTLTPSKVGKTTVTLKAEGTDDVSVDVYVAKATFNGGSLRMDITDTEGKTDYTKTAMRFGYSVELPEVLSNDNLAINWDYGFDPSYMVFNKAASKYATDGSKITSNIVFTDINQTSYSDDIYVRMNATLTIGGNTYTYTDAVRNRTVYWIAEQIAASSAVTDQTQKTYAKGILATKVDDPDSWTFTDGV